MFQSFANIATIYDKFDMEDGASAKAPSAPHFAASTKSPPGWIAENEREGAPDLVAPSGLLAIKTRSVPIVCR